MYISDIDLEYDDKTGRNFQYQISPRKVILLRVYIYIIYIVYIYNKQTFCTQDRVRMVEIITRSFYLSNLVNSTPGNYETGITPSRAFFINGNMLREESGVSEFEGWELGGGMGQTEGSLIGGNVSGWNVSVSYNEVGKISFLESGGGGGKKGYK